MATDSQTAQILHNYALHENMFTANKYIPGGGGGAKRPGRELAHGIIYSRVELYHYTTTPIMWTGTTLCLSANSEISRQNLLPLNAQ
jgi:hypothetical protein